MPLKITNDVLAEFYELSLSILELTKKREEIRQALLEKGPCATRDYVALIKESERRSLASIDIVKKILDLSESEMIEKGLMKLTPVQSVSVEPKARAA